MDPLIKKLGAAVGSGNVLSEPDELLVYECDGLPQHKYRPRAVVFPASTQETAAVMRILADARVPFTPRGAGTGLSGGALALNRGVVIEMGRMRKILKIDADNRLAVVQPGVVNAHVSRAVAHLGLHYIPDPSSQPTCTIGGNIAESAGGIHCLKYGTTTDHVLGLRVVLAGGEIVDLGGAGAEAVGYDLLGVFIGSEGTFGVATEATLRLTPIPPAVRTMLAEFAEVNAASHAVSAIIAAGVMPAALEMMDREIIRAVEASVFAAGLPLDVGAALLIELDGLEAGIDCEANQVTSICLQYGARACRLARDDNERRKLWAARKGAFGAIGRISPDSMIQDAVVPRSRLPEVLDAAYQIAAKYQLRIANVFHAGDGNLHPLICFDSRFPDEVHRVKEAGRELMETCVRAGGSITGEHGVGLDKRELLSLVFSEADMETMLLVRAAFDPTGLCNPGKIIPQLRGCGEARAVVSTGNGATRRERDEMADGLTTKPDTTSPGLQPASILPRPATQLRAPDNAHFDPAPAGQQLGRLVGESNIAEVGGFPMALAVFPASINEVSELMKLAASERWAVLPAGAMTWLDGGQSLRRVNIILSTRRLKGIIEHEPADLVAVTEAGVTLSDFNGRLAENGQWLPLDPPDDGRATIGGVVATGIGGAQQFGYGAPRRHVIGMKVVLADGKLIKVGGRVVKNVAGYDLCKLFTGSYGTLGVIVEVNFKLRPLPTATKTVIAWGRRDQLFAQARQIIKSGLFPVAIELLSPALATAADWSRENDHVLLTRFAGPANAVAQQAEQAIALLTDDHLGGPADSAADDTELWKSLAALPTRFTTDVVWRIGVQPEDTRVLLELLDRNDAVAPLWHASLGDGRLRVVESLPSANNETPEFRELIKHIDKFRASAESLGGSLIIERAPAAMRNLVNAWGSPRPAAGIMENVKRLLDPDAILSPGRFWF